VPGEIAHIIELAGVVLVVSSALVIVVGLLVALGTYLFQIHHLSLEEGYSQLKSRLAQVLMLALEILVVADVVETVTTDVSFESLAALGLLIIVRIWLSWTLELEVEGRWPWQPRMEE
jgi:uncharacterized membrane protein